MIANRGRVAVDFNSRCPPVALSVRPKISPVTVPETVAPSTPGTEVNEKSKFTAWAGTAASMADATAAERHRGVLRRDYVSTKVDIGGYGFAIVGVLLEDDTFNKLALTMTEANTREAVKAFEAAIQAGIERQRPPEHLD